MDLSFKYERKKEGREEGRRDQPQRFKKISKPRMTSARVLFREWLPQRAVCRARWMVDWELDVSLSKSWAVGR